MKNILFLIALFGTTNMKSFGQKIFHYQKCVFKVDTSQIFKFSESSNLSLLNYKNFKSRFPKMLNRTYDKILISNQDCSLSFNFKKDSFLYSVCIIKIESQKKMNEISKIILTKKLLATPSVLTFEYQIKKNYLCVIYTAVRFQNLFLKECIKNITVLVDK